jgi:hypothetical protein
MAESHVVSGLVAKRSELVGQIEKLQDEIAGIRALMDCIDGSIKLFDPDYDLRTIKGKRTNKTNGYLNHGEAQRFALDTLRAAGKPISSRDIVNEIIKRKNITVKQDTVHTIQKLVLCSLHNLEKRGIVKSAKNEDGSRSQIKFAVS